MVSHLTEYTNCTCGMEERIGMQETSILWDECSDVNNIVGTVQPRQSEECLRQRCVSRVAMSLFVYHVNVNIRSYMLLGMHGNSVSQLAYSLQIFPLPKHIIHNHIKRF